MPLSGCRAVPGGVIVAAGGSAPLGGHLWHVVAGFAVAGASVVALVWDRPRRDNHETPVRDRGTSIDRMRSRWALLAMAVASLSAAVIHARVAPEHFAESALYGVFFVGVALAQAAYAGLLVTRAQRSTIVAGAAGNALVVVLWLVTRLYAVPLGPAAGSAEEFGVLDVLASALEASVVVAAAVALWSGIPRARIGWRGYPRPAQASALAVLVGTAVVCGVARVS